MSVAVWPYYWPIQIQASPSVGYKRRVQNNQFGNGYSQKFEDGPNSETRTFAITFVGQDNDRHTNPLDVAKFLRQHVIDPFEMTPPDGEVGLFNVDAESITVTPLGGHAYQVSANVSTAVGVY